MSDAERQRVDALEELLRRAHTALWLAALEPVDPREVPTQQSLEDLLVDIEESLGEELH